MMIYVLLQVSFIGGLNFNRLYLAYVNSTGQVVKVIGQPTASTWNWAYLQGVSVSSQLTETVVYKTASGWATLASGPFYGLLYIAGGALAIFAIILLIDAVVSPSGTGWIYIGTTARTIYGMALTATYPLHS
ncbi:hypothetical protein [Vulcanisaeta sp. JCM 16159]|uniref:hypothetical protein n=1 Tax=Vulcanisaeta sp. JCM 16159 TaxID=1295371 RepID=UPI000A5DA46D|nr:hypothetical protein [Vulcanisaeta sp. JCM 16159]